MSGPVGVLLRWTEIEFFKFKRIQVGGYSKIISWAILLWRMAVGFKTVTHCHEDKFWNLWSMPSSSIAYSTME